MRSIAAGCIVGIVVSGAALLAQNPIREGRWEVTTQMQMANIPMQLPAQKTVHCITKKQLEDPGSTLPGGPDAKDKNNPCKVSDYDASGNKITWNIGVFRRSADNRQRRDRRQRRHLHRHDEDEQREARDDDEVHGKAAWRLHRITGRAHTHPHRRRACRVRGAAQLPARPE